MDAKSSDENEDDIIVESDDDLTQTIHGTKVEEQQKPVPFKKLISLAYPERYILLVALMFMIIAEGLGLIIPLLIAKAYDALVDVTLTTSQRMSDINKFMIYALIIHFVSLMAQYLRAAIMGAAGVRIVARTRNRLYQCIMKQEIAFFDVTKTGELTSRLGSDTGLLEEGISTALPEVTIGLIVVTVSIAIMLWISWKLALLMIGFLSVILCFCTPFGVVLGQLSKSYQDHLGLAQTHSTEALGAIRTVQSFAAEDKELDRYKSVIGQPEMYKYWWPTNYKQHPTTYSYAFFKSQATVLLFVVIFGLGFGGLYVVLWYGLKLVNDGELSLGKLTAFQSYIFQIGASLGQTSEFIAKLIETQGAASRIFYLMERTPAIPTPLCATNGESEGGNDNSNMDTNNVINNTYDSENPGAVAPITLSSVQGAVDFNNVSFAYPTRPNSNVLQNFSLSISPNQTAAFVGASGAGQ
jgi:ABC-type multidrug transport system fused ATPase/permease subunit